MQQYNKCRERFKITRESHKWRKNEILASFLCVWYYLKWSWLIAGRKTFRIQNYSNNNCCASHVWTFTNYSLSRPTWSLQIAPELISAERDLKIQSSCMCHGWRKKEFLAGFSCRFWLKKSWLSSEINTSRIVGYSITDCVYKLQPPEAHDYWPKFQTIPLLPYRINLRELRDRQTHITHTPSPGLRGAAKFPELGFHAVAVATPLSSFCCNRHSQFPWTQE